MKDEGRDREAGARPFCFSKQWKNLTADLTDLHGSFQSLECIFPTLGKMDKGRRDSGSGRKVAVTISFRAGLYHLSAKITERVVECCDEMFL